MTERDTLPRPDLPAPSPKLDPARIQFPTDAVTLSQMRQHDPSAFTYDALTENTAHSIDVLATHCFELILASKTFAKALNLPDPYEGTDRTEIVAMLNEAYKEYGLSTGMQQTRQMARNIEAEAARQAERFGGRHR